MKKGYETVGLDNLGYVYLHRDIFIDASDDNGRLDCIEICDLVNQVLKDAQDSGIFFSRAVNFYLKGMQERESIHTNNKSKKT